ncbi:response regulator [Paraburkholderia bengalensis]|uniref:Response regulator n=1 Tax=Paraburkholderia bengalensis TaxID=2747562 RepID=A0ABU8IZY5_9BURK
METRLLISVVDDDESVRESLPDLVREFGFDVRAFDSAESFLESGGAAHTDCLILDLMMPGMGGHELAIQLRARDINIPIIFITANHSSSARGLMSIDGVIACLYKPFSDSELSDALIKAVNKTRR